MPSVEIFSDESQGHLFDIEVQHHPNGFTYQLSIQGCQRSVLAISCSQPWIRPGSTHVSRPGTLSIRW